MARDHWRTRVKGGILRREFLGWTALGWIGGKVADTVASKLFDKGWDSVISPQTTAQPGIVAKGATDHIRVSLAESPLDDSFRLVYGRRDSRPLTPDRRLGNPP